MSKYSKCGKSIPTPNRGYKDAFYLLCDVLHRLECRGVELTKEEDKLWEEATAIDYAQKHNKEEAMEFWVIVKDPDKPGMALFVQNTTPRENRRIDLTALLTSALSFSKEQYAINFLSQKLDRRDSGGKIDPLKEFVVRRVDYTLSTGFLWNHFY